MRVLISAWRSCVGLLIICLSCSVSIPLSRILGFRCSTLINTWVRKQRFVLSAKLFYTQVTYLSM